MGKSRDVFELGVGWALAQQSVPMSIVGPRPNLRRSNCVVAMGGLEPPTSAL